MLSPSKKRLINQLISPQIILDLSVCAFFIFFNMSILQLIIPGGWTTFFLNRSKELVFLVFLLFFFIFIIIWLINKNFKLKRRFDYPELRDLVLILLPMSPVVGYVIINIEYINSFGFIYVIGIPLVFSLILVFIIPIIFSYFGSLRILMISGMALSFTILSMPTIIEDPNKHVLNSLFVTQGIYLITPFIVVYLFYILNKNIAYTIVIVFMLTGVIEKFFIVSTNTDIRNTETENRLSKFLNNDNNKIIDKKNIYLLVYESYANLETLEYYGYDNSEQINFLENNNFKVYHGIYSNGGLSMSSTSRILEISGKLSKEHRHYINGNAFGIDIFKANGYKTIGLFKSPYFFGSSNITWDEYYPKDDVNKLGAKAIIKAIYEGYFLFDIFDKNHDYTKYLNLKKKYLTTVKKEPRLFYTHNSFPGHSGGIKKCPPNHYKKYFKGMEKANIEMKNDINNLKKNDPNSIIVILADHGPYLTKNCNSLRGYEINKIDRYDVQDRYGTFLAIHWSDKKNYDNFNIEITQDIFPAILSTITNNKDLFNNLRIERRFFDQFKTKTGGVNVQDGIVEGGNDNGKPLFKNRSYKIKKK